MEKATQADDDKRKSVRSSRPDQDQSTTDISLECSEVDSTDSDNCSGVPKSVLDSYHKSNYNDTQNLPFNILLEEHTKQHIWGFKFGEANRRIVEKNMRMAMIKENNRKSGLGAHNTQDVSQASSSNSQKISDQNHKTPHSARRRQRISDRMVQNKSRQTDGISNKFPRHTKPVPLKWCADETNLWTYMNDKEEAGMHLRNARLFHDNSTVTPRMRAILLDWLMEVCDVYHLRRVTYYLSIDLFDRFLTIRSEIPRQRLQLVGITCLYMAAKIEEIYPPNLNEFNYVCDGACLVKEMVQCELLILNSLGWGIISTTPADWLSFYFQLLYKYREYLKNPATRPKISSEFVFPSFSSYEFIRAALLMDLFSLDPSFIKYRYSTVAAVALYYIFGKKTTLSITGISWEELEPCIQYTAVFYRVLQDIPDPRQHSCPNILYPPKRKLQSVCKSYQNKLKINEELFIYQPHTINMEFYERASILRLSLLTGRSTLLKSGKIIVNASDLTQQTNNTASLDEADITNNSSHPLTDDDTRNNIDLREEEVENEIAFDQATDKQLIPSPAKRGKSNESGDHCSERNVGDANKPKRKDKPQKKRHSARSLYKEETITVNQSNSNLFARNAPKTLTRSQCTKMYAFVKGEANRATFKSVLANTLSMGTNSLDD